MDVTKYRNLYFIGIKGSGMCALALLLKRLGYYIMGSDVRETFYTDDMLRQAGIEYYEGFSAQNLRRNIHNIDAVVYSAAYSLTNNEELEEAAKIFTCLSYPEALGSFSRHITSCAVVGTHGKSTTTALIGVMIKELQLPLMVLNGARVGDWDNNTVYFGGNQGFVSEVCEYRNHFNSFYANYVVLTSVEHDHPDYFDSIDDVIDAFRNFLYSVDAPKCFVAYGDSPEIRKTIDPYLIGNCIFYGEGEDNAVRITYYKCGHKKQSFIVEGISEEADKIKWEIPVPGKAIVFNTVAAFIFIREWAAQHDIEFKWKTLKKVLKEFKGVSRRCEILYKDDKYVVLDDYAHHPTAIKMTLEGIKKLYRPKRLIVDFMAHTYTRTMALIDDFTKSFKVADVLILNEIYASARELHTLKEKGLEQDIITSEQFYECVKQHHKNVRYIPNFQDVVRELEDIVEEGDVVVSMGAGDNFRITQHFANILKTKNHQDTSSPHKNQ